MSMNKALHNYECDGQISLFDIADKPLKFHEAEWLRAHGYKNVYEEPPKAGIYEFTDIEHPTKTKRLEVSENGGIMLGGLDFVARWWRPIQEESAKAADPVEDFMNPLEEAADHEEVKAAVPVCSHSGHTCNKKELWKVADTLDEIMCPHVCCRLCNTGLCGARCNGAEEPKEKVYPLDIKGICDDPYCPQCGYAFETTKTCKNYEVDCERCPECHVKVDWTPYHRLNDDEPQA